MFAERPSDKKVMGVSRRYLKQVESREIALADWFRFDNEELSVFEATRIAYALAYSAFVNVAKEPVQIMRRHFLHEEQRAEGLKPGEENITAYALRRSQNEQAYPFTSQSIHNSLQD